MALKLLLPFLFVIVFPIKIWSFDPEATFCYVRKFRNSTSQTSEQVRCLNVGADGRSLDDVLLQSTYVGMFENRTFAQLAPTIALLEAEAIGNVTITGVALSTAPILNWTQIWSINKNGSQPHLIVSRDVFKNMPSLNYLRVKGFTFENSTIEALAPLKNRLSSLLIYNCTPAKVILNEMLSFTNLNWSAAIEGLCGDEGFPVDKFNKWAKKLERIDIRNCHVSKLTKAMFSGLTRVQRLYWNYSNITEIEPGAFDDLEHLNILDLEHNKIRNLPTGLLDTLKTKKLENIRLHNHGD